MMEHVIGKCMCINRYSNLYIHVLNSV